MTRNKILIWLQWIYWISPFSWSIRSVALNEFNAPSYDYLINTGSGMVRAGTYYLEVRLALAVAALVTRLRPQCHVL